jgi:hypothetical protein
MKLRKKERERRKERKKEGTTDRVGMASKAWPVFSLSPPKSRLLSSVKRSAFGVGSNNEGSFMLGDGWYFEEEGVFIVQCTKTLFSFLLCRQVKHFCIREYNHVE